MVIGKCEYCGCEITAYYKSQLRRFCSHKCSNQWKWENIRTRGETITLSCCNCGKPIERKKSDWRIKNGAKKCFCSIQCTREYARSHHKVLICPWCGKEFYKEKRARYCSVDCANMGKKFLSYKKTHNPNISKEEFLTLYESGQAFSFAGRENAYYKEYVAENKERLMSIRKERLKNDEVYAYASQIKKQIQAVYKRNQKSVGPKLFSILGCQAQEFIHHINAQLKDGMTMENYGKWQLDHIVPISSAKTIEDVNRLCHYTNYQPLWRVDNKKKGNKTTSG